MRKLFFIILLFVVSVAYGQADQDSVYISGTTSNAIHLDQNQYIVEIYFHSGWSGTTAYINAGDIVDTTNFVTTQDVTGTRLTIESISAPCRVFFSPGSGGLYGQRNLVIVSNASETGQYITYKTTIIK